jgi:hypothetical protein
MTDDAACSIASLEQLQHLNICSTNIMDDGMMSLASLPRLAHLEVRQCAAITDAGVVRMNALTRSQELQVYR